MGKAIINKELIGNEKLYYTDGWYYCKYFALREKYCVIEDDIKAERNYSDIEEPEESDFINNPEIKTSYKIIDNKEYVISDFSNISYKIPLKFYKNIIKKSGCFACANVCLWENYTSSEPLVLIDYIENSNSLYPDLEVIVGWLEPCAFEFVAYNNIYEEDLEMYAEEYKEEDNEEKKIISKDVQDNFIFKDVRNFENGFAEVRFNKYCAKLDLNGNITQKAECKDRIFYDEYTAVNLGGKWGVVDSDNNFIIPPKYNEICICTNNKWCVRLNNKWGVINNKNKMIIEPNYKDLCPVYDKSEQIMAKKDNLWGIIDLKENIIIPFEYDNIEPCVTKQNRFLVHKNNFYGIIDDKNNIIFPCIYKYIFYLDEEILAVSMSEDKYILLNENSEQICSKTFEEIRENFIDTDIYPAQLNGLWGFIDKYGNTKIDFQYADVSPFYNGYANAQENKKPYNTGLIDEQGNLVLSYRYKMYSISALSNDRFLIQNCDETKPIIVDRNHNIIVDELYEFIEPYSENSDYYKARFDENHEGFIDKDGNVLKINKESLKIPAIKLNYDTLNQKDKVKAVFDGEEIKEN